ncbi:RHS repeat-associated core domain-containing protein [Pelagibius sp. Alg239-R121]|uniref:RHS repeat-associated core domain-containing protein n=1 Tax=Pelagibius sp. Alg239-R121 TaxID=2993448 RepID=UPI0024A61CAC|nr:RHS repeat-associated core domain-containing protein [Pelagibius sp. Alg239-R121]
MAENTVQRSPLSVPRLLSFGSKTVAGQRGLLLSAVTAVGLLIAGGPTALAQTTVAGVTPGSLAVDETGAANYRLPIEVPPGVAGLSPDLSLLYRSRKKNGILGVGWVLDGVSVIERCSRTTAQDGARGGIDYSANDRFCLDNERLVSVGTGTYGDNGTEYRTEIQSFSKVVSNGTAGTGPLSFTVWTKSGQILEYGNTADSRVEVPGQSDVRYWALNKVSDRFGNEMTFSYAEDTTATSATENTHKLTRIDYGGNTSQSTSAQASVQLTYEARTDTRVSYVAQARSQLLERLKTIDTYAKVGVTDTLVKRYNLAYTPGDATGRSRLTSVTECDGDLATPSCFEPVSFTYSDLVVGTAAFSLDSALNLRDVIEDKTKNLRRGEFVDADGDGRTDWVRAYRDAGGTAKQATYLNDGASWVYTPSLNLPDVIVDRIDELRRGEFVDVNGDGLVDWVRAYRNGAGSAKQATFLNNGTNWDYTPSFNLPDVIEDKVDNLRRGEFVDVNGDGLIDWVRAYKNAAGSIKQATYLNNNGTSWVWTPSLNLPDVIEDKSKNLKRGEFVDVDGDGLVDWVRAYKDGNGSISQATWLNSGSAWIYTPSYNLPDVIEDKSANLRRGEFVDVNGDGLADWVRAYKDGNGSINQATWLNSGTGWVLTPSYNLPDVIEDKSKNLERGEFVDVNGDGLVDWVRAYKDAAATIKQATWLNSGKGWVFTTSYDLPDVIEDKPKDLKRGEFVDANGDGLADWVRAYMDSAGTIKQATWLGLAKTPDTLISVTGSLGRVASVTYKPLTDDTVYSKDSGALFPERDIQVSAHVVSQISRDDGLGGQKATDYTYAGGRYHDQGRRFLGFREMTATDVQTGNVTTTTYERDYRYSGFVKENKIAIANGALLEKTTYTWASTETAVTGQPSIVFPHLAQSTTERYEINDGDGNSPLISETVANTFDSYGNPTLIVGTTTGYPAAGDTETFTTTSTNTFTNDTTNWLIGQRTRTEVAKSRYGGSAVTRTMSWVYDVTTGRVTQEVIEPDTSTHKLTRDYSYDVFGNLTGTTISGGNIATRTTSAAYDSNGLLMVSASNALGHGENRTMDARYGVTTSQTDPNLLTTTWLYDGFGRRTKELRADGTETQYNYELCSGAGNPCTAPAGTIYLIESQDFLTAGQTAISGKSITYFDKLNRKLRSETEGFANGSKIHVDSKYNVRGFIEEVSRPYFAGTAAANIKWTKTFYDVVGRRLNLIEPDNRYFTTSYDGFKTVNTNPLSQVEDRITNALGELVSSRDHLNAVSSYNYDAFGNLISTDVEGLVTTMTYDIRGNRITMDDPDMGYWTYAHDVLGQLLTQNDAKNQMVTMTYDKLGRISTRVEAEGTTNWTYDNAMTGVGKIHQISGPNGYLQVQSYDSLGRSDQTTRTISGSVYATSMTYDAAGREDTRTYPSGFAVQNSYNARGYLASVSEVLGGTTYWQANTVNAEGKITQETLGNGVVTDRSYDPARNLVQSITSTSGANTVQDLTFVFDQMGNLTERRDLQRDRTEDFTYDNRNQLLSATLSETSTTNQLGTPTTYSYDLIGNITNKSDIGNYLYGQNGAGPHAVTTAGSNTYSYDANGGMISGAGRTVAWTSFRKPQLITDALTGNQTSFVYGPDRARIEQNALTNGLTTTTTYIGNTYERRSRLSQPDELVHYIRASDTVAIFTKMDDGNALTDKTRYLHRDHIYSVESITDETGTVTEHLSYDAHGKRRKTDWQAGPPVAQPNETPRGFTGHEHLDGVGLIHMNGRVYEPTLGRFLSPDPYVQIPETPKGFNRYTYVFNNPLSFTDPSGFFANDAGFNGEGDIGQSCCGFGDSANDGHDGGGSDGGLAEAGTGKQTNPSSTSKSSRGHTGYDASTDHLGLHELGGLNNFGWADTYIGPYPYSDQFADFATEVAKGIGYDEIGKRVDPPKNQHEEKARTFGATLSSVFSGVLPGRVPSSKYGNTKALPNQSKIADVAEDISQQVREALGLTGKRRAQNPADATYPTERAARRAAFRANNVPTSKANNYSVTQEYGSPNLSGPKNRPSQTIDTEDVNGNPVSIPNHRNGHKFEDNNTYEAPHYQGPKGEHFNYDELK